MRIDAIAWRRLTWRMSGAGAARGRALRTAIVVEVRADDTRGWGEAAPLPELAHDSLAAAERAIAALAAPFDVDDVATFAASIASPSARFAIETALLDAIARRDGRPLAALLSAEPAQRLAASIVVDDPAAARAAIARGARCLKIKVADGDLARVRAIADAAPGVALRLDANRAWPIEHVRDRLAALADLPIEFVEEPCVAPHRLLGEPLPLPLALDETLAELTDAELATALSSRSLRAVILKPTLLGLHACVALVEQARAAGVAAIVTHALEGPIGTAACAELALAVGGDRAVGLAPHPALDAWQPAVPQLHDTEIVAVERAGLGLAPATVERPLARDASVTMPRRRDRLRVVIAEPTAATVDAIERALDDEVPIALVHAALPADAQARQRAEVERAELPDDAAAILFTSGSTGTPRGVVLSRGALVAAADASAAHLGWHDDDRWLLALSMAHAGGLAIVVRCLAGGRPIVLAEGGFDRARVAERLPQATLASLVPTQLAALLDDPAWRAPATLRAVLLGGAAASDTLLEAAAARGVPFLTTYGMTEALGQVATAPLARAGDPHAPLHALRGVELAAGTRDAPSVIRVRAPMLATRYLDGTPIAPVLVTADLGYLDDTGALHVVGRADDVIITGGENVHPSAVEAVLAATPGIRAACAFGVGHERWGQLVGAAITVEPSFDRARAVAHWQHVLAPHQRPRELAIVAALPVLATGKHDRRAAARLPREPVIYPRP
ncbi:MAG TPA: AMP-binding protein [Kofleriaceae bacterium]|nr:AMP-binding protein [Kofleriaceae bacterium]